MFFGSPSAQNIKKILQNGLSYYLSSFRAEWGEVEITLVIKYR